MDDINIGWLVVGVIFVWILLRTNKQHNLHNEFKIPAAAKVLSTDLGGLQKGKPIQSNGVIGFADVIFKLKKDIFVCEYKARRFNGQLRSYEYYQVILYMGIVRDLYSIMPVGRLKYKNAIIDIEFDQTVFSSLIFMKNELEKVRNSNNPFKTCPKPLDEMISYKMRFRYV